MFLRVFHWNHPQLDLRLLPDHQILRGRIAPQIAQIGHDQQGIELRYIHSAATCPQIRRTRGFWNLPKPTWEIRVLTTEIC